MVSFIFSDQVSSFCSNCLIISDRYSLIIKAYESSSPSALVIQAYSTAWHWTLKYRDDLVELKWSDTKRLFSMVKSLVKANNLLRLDEQTLHQFTIVSVEVFLSGIEQVLEGNSIAVAFTKLYSAKPNVEIEKNTLLLQRPWPFRSSESISKALVVLFDENIEFLTLNDLDSVSTTTRRTETERYEALDQFIQQLMDLNVNIVASQKLIPIYIKSKLQFHQILFLDKLSAKYIDLFAKVTGSERFNCIQQLDKQYFGYIERMERRVLSNQEFISIQGAPPERNSTPDRIVPVTNVILSGPDDLWLTEAQSEMEVKCTTCHLCND